MRQTVREIPAPRQYFRIIPRDQAIRTDFVSNAELGRRPARELTPEDERLWDGLSMFDSLENALKHRRRHRNLGRYVAEVNLTSADLFRAERTGRSQGHWTVWADSHILLERVTAIIAVEEER